MPCYSLLGIEICIPSLEDIVNAIVAPIIAHITSSLETLIDTTSILWDTMISILAPSFSAVIEAIISFVEDPLGSLISFGEKIWAIVQNIGGLIIGEISGLWSQISFKLGFIHTVLTSAFEVTWRQIVDTAEYIASRVEAIPSLVVSGVEGAIATIGPVLSSAIETAQDTILTAFDGVGDAISSVIGGVFQGFGFLDVAAVGVQTISLLRGSPFGATPPMRYVEPYTIGDLSLETMRLANEQRDHWYEMYILSLTIEGLSLGQVDSHATMLFQEPTVRASQDLATEWFALPYKIGWGIPAERYWNSVFTPNIPPYPDLISIYVKEGYLESHWVELPPEMVDNFAELGLNEYWTKRLWGKHWVYPSPTQLYEMRHRTEGTQPEIAVSSEVLRNMLKLHDFEPKWRGPLEAISWATWRIFDIRREWELGGGDELLEKRLIDTGYNPDVDAPSLAEVQKWYVFRTDVLRLLGESDIDFIDGWIGEGQLRANYESTPLNPLTIDMRIARATLRRERELKKDLKTALRDRYIKGDLDRPEFEEELSRLGVVQEWIGAEVAKANARKYKRVSEDTPIETRVLTVSQYGRALKYGVMPERAFRDKMTKFKYGPEDINILVALYVPEPVKDEELPELTEAYLRAAFRAQTLTETQLRTELTRRRYLPEDIDIIVETEKRKIKVPPVKPTPEEIKLLSVGQLRAAFSAMVITSREFSAELRERDYIPTDIERLLFTELAKWDEEELRKGFRTEYITEGELRRELTKREYLEADIEKLITEEILKRRGL